MSILPCFKINETEVINTSAVHKSIGKSCCCRDQYIKNSMFAMAVWLSSRCLKSIRQASFHSNIINRNYRQTSNIRGTLAGNKIISHSYVVGGSSAGVASPTSSLRIPPFTCSCFILLGNIYIYIFITVKGTSSSVKSSSKLTVRWPK